MISHTAAEGTVLDGTRRGDDLYSLLRSLGWNYRRSVGDYRLQASQDRPVKHAAITRTAAALQRRGFTVTLHLDTTPRPVVDAETDRADRADERADRLTGRAERLRAQALGREAAADRVLENIPLGQPFLVDHSGYAADRRRRERAWANQERAVALDRDAAATEQAAQVAAAHVAHRHTPETVVNRIAELQANLRRAGRRRAEHAQRDRLILGGARPEDVGLAGLTAQACAQLAEWEQHWAALLSTGARSGPRRSPTGPRPTTAATPSPGVTWSCSAATGTRCCGSTRRRCRSRPGWVGTGTTRSATR